MCALLQQGTDTLIAEVSFAVTMDGSSLALSHPMDRREVLVCCPMLALWQRKFCIIPRTRVRLVNFSSTEKVMVGLTIANMSFGTTVKFEGECDTTTSYNMAFAKAFDTLLSKGVIAFASSDNDSNEVGAPACLGKQLLWLHLTITTMQLALQTAMRRLISLPLVLELPATFWTTRS